MHTCRLPLTLLSLAVLLAASPAMPAAYAVPAGRTLYVATDGVDRTAGPSPSASRPLRTLQGALDWMRGHPAPGRPAGAGVTVELRGGAYELARPVELTATDSGQAGAPLVIRARGREAVRIVGGRQVHGFAPVADPAVLARLDPAARGHVLQADLRAQGITDLSGVRTSGAWAQSEPGIELFYDDRPMTLARWPNTGFTRIADTLGIQPVDIRGTRGDAVGKLGVSNRTEAARYAIEHGLAPRQG